MNDKFRFLSLLALLGAPFAHAEKAKSYQAIDQYIDNFNQVFATAEKNPSAPGKVLELDSIKTFSQKEKQYLSSLLLLDVKPSRYRLTRNQNEMSLLDLTKQQKLVSFDVADVDETRMLTFKGHKIDLLQYFGEGDLQTHAQGLARLLGQLSVMDQAKQEKQKNWSDAFFAFAQKVFLFPFQLNSAWAHADNVPTDSPLGMKIAAAKAAGAAGKCKLERLYEKPVFCVPENPGTAPTANSFRGPQSGYLWKDQNGQASTYNMKGQAATFH